MSLSASFGAIAAPNEVFHYRREREQGAPFPLVRYQTTDVLAPEHRWAQKTEQELWEAIQPKTIQDAYSELEDLFGRDVSRQYEETISALQQQFDLLEERERTLKREAEQPEDPLARMLPMLMLGAMSGDMQTALLGMILQTVMQPQYERQRRDRYWKAITEVLGEKNKVISALRMWEQLSLQERRELLRQARMYTGQLNQTALRALSTFASRRLQEFRLGLEQERNAYTRQLRARGQYFRGYNEMMRVLEMYHHPQARSEILQAFSGSLSEMAREAGLSNPPHLQLLGVLQHPSLRATQSVMSLAQAAQRGELNQVLFHSAQLGLIQKLTAIERAKDLLNRARTGRTERLSPSALAMIYRYSHFIEQQAYSDPETYQALRDAYGDDWVQQMRNIRANIAQTIVQLGEPSLSGRLTPDQRDDLVQAIAHDESRFNSYLRRVLGVSDLDSMPVEDDALAFLQDLYGGMRFEAKVGPDGVATLSFSDVVQQIYQRALASVGSHLNWSPEAMDSPRPLPGPANAEESADFGSRTVEPTTGNRGGTPVAVRPITELLYPNATSTNLLDLTALARAVNAGATIQIPTPSPELNRTLTQIQSRHLVQLRTPSGDTLYETVPLIGLAQVGADTDQATIRRYQGLHAHRVLRDTRTNQLVLGLSVPVMSYSIQTAQGPLRYDFTPELRRILYDPNTRTDADLVVIQTDANTRTPAVVISVLYPVQTQGRVQGYRVPLLVLPMHAFETLFTNWLEDKGLNQYQLPSQFEAVSASESATLFPQLTQIRAWFASGGLWDQLIQRVQTILNTPGNEAEQRTALQRVWREFRESIRASLGGQDLFRTLRWLPIAYN